MSNTCCNVPMMSCLIRGVDAYGIRRDVTELMEKFNAPGADAIPHATRLKLFTQVHDRVSFNTCESLSIGFLKFFTSPGLICSHKHRFWLVF